VGPLTIVAKIHKTWLSADIEIHPGMANIIIANATKRDGSQMRMISLLGMTFLPGTFLAVSPINHLNTYQLEESIAQRMRN